ncbi:thiopurine S-methyltransferase [Elysia marginata]|uniref:Thiopurine S-methyltransferase n=1 Tax=Elysia marginata TaxID=1093978 RepID=A0AAV4HD15_9GAST|nr:thiopurine S-methyltransferase [Elysia marginata]
MLMDHYQKLNPSGKATPVFYPMCGMSLDMNWLVEQGVSVVGVELVLEALQKFMSRSEDCWSKTCVPELGVDAKLFTRRDNKLKLYCSDVLAFSPKIEGKFDAMYDRGSLQFVEPETQTR